MFESQSPEKKSEHLRWRFARLAVRAKLNGWVVGDPIGLATHYDEGLARAGLDSHLDN